MESTSILNLLFLTALYLPTQYLYWIAAYIPASQPSPTALVIKCIPVTALALALLISPFKKPQQRHSYVKYVTLGLACSVLGDAFLVYEECFIPGMLAFAVAQVDNAVYFLLMFFTWCIRIYCKNIEYRKYHVKFQSYFVPNSIFFAHLVTIKF